MDTKANTKKALRFLSALTALVVCMTTGRVSAEESKIFVYKEADGSIHFTNKTPPSGVRAEVFTSHSGGYTVVGHSGRTGKFFPDSFNGMIGEAAKAHQVEAGLIKAVIHVESGFNPQAISKRGARGLMQLMPATARELGVRNPFQPSSNILGGTQYLARLIRKYQGNVAYALAAYNAGEDAVHRYKGIPPYSETQAYVKRVLLMKNRYASISNG